MYKLIRIVSLVVVALGCLVYLYMWFLWSIDWRHSHIVHESVWTEVWFILDRVIILSGLAPLMLTLYFLLYRKSVRDNAWGMLFVLISVLVHAYVYGVTAHAPAQAYVPIQAAELLVAIVLIWYWHRKFPRHQSS